MKDGMNAFRGLLACVPQINQHLNTYPNHPSISLSPYADTPAAFRLNIAESS